MRLEKENFTDVGVLKGKIIQVKAGSKGNCVVRVDFASLFNDSYRFQFTYLETEDGKTMPSLQDIMLCPVDKMFEIYGYINYWETWEDYCNDIR